MTTITPTEHNRNEWARFAQDAYNHHQSFYGHRYSVAAATMTGPVRVDVFDTLQRVYREWLLNGFTNL